MFGKKGNLIGLILSAVCLYLVFRKVDLHALWASMSALRYGYLVGAIAVFLTTFAVRTVRWQALLHPAKAIPFRRLSSVLFIGYMANNILPARLGEFVRAYVLGRKEGVRKSTTLATIFIERIFDGLSLLFILGLLILAHKVGLISNRLPPQLITGGLLASLIFLGAFGFVAALEFVPGMEALLGNLIRRFAPAKAAPKLESVLSAFVGGVACLRSLKRLIFVFATSLVVWGIEGSTYSLMGRAFHMHQPLTAFFVTMVLVNLAAIVPSAPGQVGTFQFFCVLGLGMFGVSQVAALSYGLVLNMAEYLPVTLLGIGFLLAENLTFQAVLHPDEEPAEPAELPSAASSLVP
ncbi:MAG TPA: lysylphosphatidylglycerol synthase transmembrane domain-containing protein [Oscillatoriaceae cyanobacterium]